MFSDEIRDHFLPFGILSVDWPHKAQSKAYFPPKGTSYCCCCLHWFSVVCVQSSYNYLLNKHSNTVIGCFVISVNLECYNHWINIFILLGYAFLIFQEEGSVHALIKNCAMDDGKLYMFVSSVTQTNKKVSCLHTDRACVVTTNTICTIVATLIYTDYGKRGLYLYYNLHDNSYA